MEKNTTKTTVWKCLTALLSLLLVIVIVGIVLLLIWPVGSGSSGSALEPSQTELHTSAPLDSETQVIPEIQVTGSGAQATEDNEDLTADYIIPVSNTKLLTDSDIEGLSARELNYAKNEIYARHGRIFDSTELREYFESKSWYEGRYTADEFDGMSGSILTATEKTNAEFLSDAENKLSPGGYKLDQ